MTKPMDEEMPVEVDFSAAARGRYHISAETTVFLPASIEKIVWKYFSVRRDIEINESAEIELCSRFRP